MGKREKLIDKFTNYVFGKMVTGEWTDDESKKFMYGVHSAVSEFVFDDEKTPLDVSIEPVKTKWHSPYQTAPANNTSVLAKYTDDEEPMHEVIEFVDGEWWDPNEVRRPFIWTRIPE